MLAEVRGRSQITIPTDVVKRIGIKEGDLFDVIEKDGGIFLCPVVVYPKAKIEQLARLVAETEDDIKKGNSKVFSDIDQMFRDMDVSVDV